jgi:hypothetical protein
MLIRLYSPLWQLPERGFSNQSEQKSVNVRGACVAVLLQTQGGYPDVCASARRDALNFVVRRQFRPVVCQRLSVLTAAGLHHQAALVL